MTLDLFEQKYGSRGPTTHCAVVRDLEYPYQVEQWVIDLETDEPQVVRCVCPELGRVWERRADGRFCEVRGGSVTPPGDPP